MDAIKRLFTFLKSELEKVIYAFPLPLQLANE